MLSTVMLAVIAVLCVFSNASLSRSNAVNTQDMIADN